MAAPKENLLSLGHMTSTDRNTFTKQKPHSLKNSVHKPSLMQTDFSTQQRHQHLRVMHLQQRWQELKERELAAQEHNRQLLQQFEKAQDTLREMLARNAAMKTIRMEYERYLEESAPRWRQQLKEKTQAAQMKRMEEYVRSCLNNTEQEQMTKSSADQPSISQGLAKRPQKVSAPQENYQNSHYSQGVSSQPPYMQSWLTHPAARFPIRVPSQPQGSSHAPPSYLPPPSIFPHPHQFQLQQLASSSSHHYPWPGHDPPGWASPQPNYPWPWPTGAAGIPSGSGPLWGQLYTEEEPPHHERGADGGETSRVSSSKRERGGGSRSSHLSQELDIKPVRLSNGHTESSESGRDSSLASREKTKKKEKRGKTQRPSSDRDRSSSQESSGSSSAVVIAGVAVAQNSDSDTSSEQRSTSGSRRTRTRSGGFAAGLPRMEEVENGRSREKGGDSGSHNEESESISEESVNRINGSRSENVMKGNPDDNPDSCGEEEESKSVSAEDENGDTDVENQERSISAEESNDKEKNEEEELEDVGEGDDGNDDEEKENSQRNEEQEERNVEEDDGGVSARKNTEDEEEEEEEETGAEEELEDDGDEEDDDLKDEDGGNKTQGSATSEDEEEESEEDENKKGEAKGASDEEEDGEGEEEEEEEELRSHEEEEERDSDDSIISPQETRLKKIHIIPEEAAEDEEEERGGSKTGSSDKDEESIGFSEEDDIEELLAPQEQKKKKEEKELKADDKPEATCDKVEAFQVELDNSTKTDHQSDSDEFDDFYD